jgi:hypothetical protein
MSEAAKAKAKAGTDTSGSFSSSRRRVRVHAICSDADGTPNVSTFPVIGTDADDVLDSMASISKECEEVLRTLQQGTDSPSLSAGGGDGGRGGGGGRKGRSVSYTNARSRHEAYNYTVMQSNK